MPPVTFQWPVWCNARRAHVRISFWCSSIVIRMAQTERLLGAALGSPCLSIVALTHHVATPIDRRDSIKQVETMHGHDSGEHHSAVEAFTTSNTSRRCYSMRDTLHPVLETQHRVADRWRVGWIDSCWLPMQADLTARSWRPCVVRTMFVCI